MSHPEIDLLQKIDTANTSSNIPGYSDGKTIYKTYCSSCHKEDRKGEEPIYPSLIDLKKRMTETEVLNKIREGGRKMPPFARILKGHEKPVIDYLFENQDKQLSQKENDLLEIQHNRSSNIEVKNEKAKIDTASEYLNVKAYAVLRGPDGYSAIKPPWGTLNAINLNTGEYEWTIPVGNYPELQKKGEPLHGCYKFAGANSDSRRTRFFRRYEGS